MKVKKYSRLDGRDGRLEILKIRWKKDARSVILKVRWKR